MTLSELSSWIVSHGLALVVGGLILFGLYRLADSLIPGSSPACSTSSNTALAAETPADELRKRESTLKEVLGKLIRAGFLIALVVLVLGVFDLLGVLGRPGPRRRGADARRAGDRPRLPDGDPHPDRGSLLPGRLDRDQRRGVNVEGRVEEITLRRTTLATVMGQLHSVSNGLIRVSSNTTRVYSLGDGRGPGAAPARRRQGHRDRRAGRPRAGRG
jgi:small-conductance mechanosensitive channel